MKKTLKIVFFIFAIIFLLACCFLIWALSVTSNYKLDESKLINLQYSVTFYDENNNLLDSQANGVSITEFNEIPIHTINAFIAIEDKRFYAHNGVDFKRIIGATINNVKSFSFKEGASTITQQLIKNTHLKSEKTLKRKITEIKLAKQLEKRYSKNEILEKYLNTIYFGNNCYGITSAADFYFNKKVEDLTINESAILAGIVKAPSHYSPLSDREKCFKRKNLVLKCMHEQGYISDGEYQSNIEQDAYYQSTENKTFNGLYFVKNQLNHITESSPYSLTNIEVYTTINKHIQNILENKGQDYCDNFNISVLCLDKNSNVLGYFSTVKEEKRQIGSIIKPLAVFAPAIERDLVDSFTKIDDEKTNFSGYSPSNYNDKYFGKITVKEALEKSSNVCAVKLLNYVGINNAVSYLHKMNLQIYQNDESLSLALGATAHGATLSQLTSSYSVFLNGGNFKDYNAFNSVKSNELQINHALNYTKVFNTDTVSIINDMLKGTVKNGTAKKLSSLPFPVYAKTGTVGTKSGNSDAYTISFTNDYILGVWFGSKCDGLMPNSVTGGSLPCSLSKDIWEEIYNNKIYPVDIPLSGVKRIFIDKISYDNDNTVLIADDNAPKRYVEEVLIKEKNIPNKKSDLFTNPKTSKPKLSINDKGILIELCLTEYCGASVYRYENKKKVLVFDTENIKTNSYLDTMIEKNEKYIYSVIPYFKSASGKKYFGKEVFTEKIKAPSNPLGDKWWNNDYD